MCAGLIISAKYHLLHNNQVQALDLLKKASISCAGSTRFLRKMVTLLLDFNLVSETQEIIARFPAHEQEKPDYLACKYLVEDRNAEVGAVIESGRKLLGKGVKDSDVYRILIQRLIETKKFDNAEHLARELSEFDAPAGKEILSTIELLSQEVKLSEAEAG
jgi:hypothetical protein